MNQTKGHSSSSTSSPSSVGMIQRCCEQSGYGRMSSAETAIMRAVIVLAMTVAVVTVVYLTPVPDQSYKTCDRPCHDLDWPMICRYKLQIEIPESINGVCESCYNNFTQCADESCSSEDTRKIVVTNRQIPGPAIQVCQNDVLVIDVVNKIPGQSVTIHWRGQENVESPHMDGVPMITQCPIPSFTTFQYKFRATNPGTHFYHAYSDADRTNGLFGSLIVRQSKKSEAYRKLYDIDDKDHVVLVNEWADSNSKDQTNLLLINGKAPTQTASALSTFHVEKNKRYRFRMAYTSGSSGCPITVSIDNHLMKIIGLDGKPINPYEVSSIVLSKGERLDFVLKANQEKSSYFLRAKSRCNGKNEGLAIVNYDGALTNGHEKSHLSLENRREFDTTLCGSKLGRVCLGDVKSLHKMPEELRKETVDRTIFLVLDAKTVNIDDNFQSKIYAINNITFTFPSSPLLTQIEDVNHETMCNRIDVPTKCIGQEVCECVHTEHIPLGATIEMIIINQGVGSEEHIFHLHGHHFYVIAHRNFEPDFKLHEIKALHESDQLFKRNFNSPVLKDTIRVPKNSAVAFRFIANSPGFWMLRDEKSKGWTRGLDVVLRVGGSGDIPAAPEKFPTCGSFIGPTFFLI